MALFNYSTKEVIAKIVYYGPGLCGKTTNLRFIYESLPSNSKSKMISLSTNQDRTLFFDFLPLELGTIKGMTVRLQLYTVPGQVFYNSTRQLVLKGADGVIFVADSQQFMEDANIESWNNLKENLLSHGLILKNFPHILQYNKRDLPDILPIDYLNSQLNEYNMPYFEAIATTGYNVEATLKELTKMVLQDLIKKYGISSQDTILAEDIILIPQETQKKATITIGGSIMGIEDETLDSLWEKQEEEKSISFEGEEFEFKEVKKEEMPLNETEPLGDLIEKTKEKEIIFENQVFEKPLKEATPPKENEIIMEKEMIIEEPIPLSAEKIEKQLSVSKELSKVKEANLNILLSEEELENLENLELIIRIKFEKG